MEGKKVFRSGTNGLDFQAAICSTNSATSMAVFLPAVCSKPLMADKQCSGKVLCAR